MNIGRIKNFFRLNAPSIMTGIGVAGVIVTAIASGKATLDARDRIELANTMAQVRGETLTKMDILKRVWTAYIPTVLSAATSITCILAAHNVNIRRQAALVTIYQIAERGFEQYKEHVVDAIGHTAERKIRENVDQSRLNDDPVSKTEVYITSSNPSHLFYDSISGRYFTSDTETVRRAENDTNYQIINNMSASLNDFYGRVGLPGTHMGDEVGWNTDRPLEVMFTTMISDDNRPCMVVNYRRSPGHFFGNWR